MNEQRIQELANRAIRPWSPASPRVIDAEVASVAQAIRTAVNEALDSAAIQVFIVRQESELEDADDKGTSGWLQDAEQRIRARKLP